MSARLRVLPPPQPRRNLVAIVAEALAMRGMSGELAVDTATDILLLLRESGYSVLPSERRTSGA